MQTNTINQWFNKKITNFLDLQNQPYHELNSLINKILIEKNQFHSN